MVSTVIVGSGEWAEQQFSRVDVGDKRRTRRVVNMAARMM